MQYLANFRGRLVGAIGIFYGHSVIVEGNSLGDARLNIYRTHEHVSGLTLFPLTNVGRVQSGIRVRLVDQTSDGVICGEICTINGMGGLHNTSVTATAIGGDSLFLDPSRMCYIVED